MHFLRLLIIHHNLLLNKLLKIDEKGENVIEDFEDEEQEEKSQDYDKEPIR